MSLSIVYDDIAKNVKQYCTASEGGAHAACAESDILTDATVNNVAFCYPRYAKLSYGMSNPAQTLYGGIGWVSSAISSDNGTFTTAPTLTISSSTTITAKGIVLTFNKFTGDCATKFTIELYYADSLVDTVTVTDNEAIVCSVQTAAVRFDKIVVRFAATSKPYRPIMIHGIEFGTRTTLNDEHITSHSITWETSIDSGAAIISTIDFTVSTQTAPELPEVGRKIKAYNGDTQLMTAYVTRKRKTGEYAVEVEAECALSRLEKISHGGNMYSGITAATLLSELLGTSGVSYELPGFKSNVTLSGYIPPCTLREALRQVAFALGLIIDATSNDRIKLLTLPSSVSSVVPASRSYESSSSTKDVDEVAKIEVTTTSYTEGTGEAVELFADFLVGLTTIELDEPHGDYAITGGAIISSSCNRVIISAGSGDMGFFVCLTGVPMAKRVQTRSISCSDSGTDIIEADMTLWTDDDASAGMANTLNRLKTLYTRNTEVDAKIIVDGERLADFITVSKWGKSYSGYINRMKFTIGSSSMAAEVTMI